MRHQNHISSFILGNNLLGAAFESYDKRNKTKKTASHSKEQDEIEKLWLAMLQVEFLYQPTDEDDLPSDPRQRDSYYAEQLRHGMSYCKQGTDKYANAAICFFLALKACKERKVMVCKYKEVLPKTVYALVLHLDSTEQSMLGTSMNLVQYV
jgi:hypothetical protein